MRSQPHSNRIVWSCVLDECVFVGAGLGRGLFVLFEHEPVSQEKKNDKDGW